MSRYTRRSISVKRGTVTVAGKPGLDVPAATLTAILKQARA